MEQISDISLSAIVIGLGSIIGQFGIPKKLMPVVNIVLGIGMRLISNGAPLGIKILEGIVLGLLASGLYSSTKNVTQHIIDNK